MPRSISEILHWKSSEFRLWLFYYSIPILSGIMRPDYLEQYLMFVTGIALLNTNMIEQSRKLLHKFVRTFPEKTSQNKEKNLFKLL